MAKSKGVITKKVVVSSKDAARAYERARQTGEDASLLMLMTAFQNEVQKGKRRMPRRRSAAADPIIALEAAVLRLAARKPYRRGDLVQWRARSKDGPLPRMGEPAVVVKQTPEGQVLMIVAGADGVGVPVWTEAWRLEPASARQCGETIH